MSTTLIALELHKVLAFPLGSLVCSSLNLFPFCCVLFALLFCSPFLLFLSFSVGTVSPLYKFLTRITLNVC